MKPKITKRSSTYALPIVILPTSTPLETLTELRDSGYVPVLCDDPSKIKVIIPETKAHANDMLMSAMHGLSATHSTSERSRMVEELHRRLLKNENVK